jgi:serine/threonine-protein kinase
VSIPPRAIDAGVGIGEIFIDKYRVDAILGHGGMGVVALCTHLALNEQVAIKMLRKDVLDDADAVERFMREAQAASKLKSEYVARVTDVGRSPTNVPYMVMEYLDGHDLGELLHRGGIGLPWAIEITLQSCEALAEAHSIGIVHRDVKPTNLFVTWRPDGSALVKVLDFGISKALAGGALELTQTQSLLGTPAYMSPEQMRSARQVDTRTDIWSLGTVLYELLEGRRPFEAESFSEMCVKVAVDPPGPMIKSPPALQQVVLRCLEKLPEHRYASMAELGADLVAFSHDPHQAHVLVERMTRTLRRSQIADWESASSGNSGPVRQLRSIEIGVTASDPAIPMRMLSEAAQIALTAPTEPVTTTALPSDTLAVPGKRRRQRAVLIAVAVTVAAALGVVVSLSRDPVPAPARTAEPPIVAPVEKPSADSAQPAPAAAAEPARVELPVRRAKPAIDKPPASRPRPAAHDEPAKRDSHAVDPRAPHKSVCDPFADPHTCLPGETAAREN